MVKKMMAALVLTMAAVVFVGAGPAMAQYQPGLPGFVLDPPQTGPREPVTVIGTGCPRNSDVVVSIGGTTVATTVAQDNEQGSFETTFPAPPTPGEYVVVVECGPIVMSQLLLVTESPCGFIIRGAPGASVSAVAPGFRVGTPYQLTFFSTPVNVGGGTVDADPQPFTFTIPQTATAGDHVLKVEGTGNNGQPRSLECPAEVLTGTATATTAGTLPRTGGDPAPLVQLGLGLVAVGGLVLLAMRRRNGTVS